MPTPDFTSNQILLKNIETTVKEVKSELQVLTKLIYGKNGNSAAVGLLEIVHANATWIYDQKDRRKWAVRGMVGLFLINVAAMVSGVWYFVHFGSKM